ncbi:hypothetical protein NDU88_007233 [Pleurodeles waltl]|uniref:Uncharacterized protein n=1 Tax=Pleurodeles waltl TaxID=8319 RepID=A0AAV7UN89_PLEWA|nr:hypothetical protein NDU88_007233 [Pleurodeles waltl]
MGTPRPPAPRRREKKKRSPSPIQRLGRTHGVAPRGVAGNIGGLGRGRDPPGQTRGEARCLLPALLRPPHLPNAKDEAQSRCARWGRERPGPRTQEGPSGPGGCGPRPAMKKSREPRRRESPGKKRNPLQQILGGGGHIPRLLSCIPPPRPESRSPEPRRGDRPRSRRWIGGKNSITETTTNRGTGPGGLCCD